MAKYVKSEPPLVPKPPLRTHTFEFTDNERDILLTIMWETTASRGNLHYHQEIYNVLFEAGGTRRKHTDIEIIVKGVAINA